MKTIAVIFFVFILLSAMAYAETEIFSGTVITGTDKVVDGGIFRFAYDEPSNQVFVQTPATSLIVENGKCKSSSVFRVCINRANFSYKNITTYEYYYEIDAVIYKLTGSLSTNSKITQSDLLQKEPAEFTITITNPTEFDINNILYKEDLTPFSITEVKGCNLEGNQITWQGALQSKYHNTCTAKIFSEEKGAYALSGSLSYFNGFENENKTTDSVTIKVLPHQLGINQIIDKDIQVKQPFYINVSLQNINSEERIDLAMDIELPSNINLLKIKPGLSRDFNFLKYSLFLEPGEYFNYSMYLEASNIADNPIVQKFDYSIKGIKYVLQNYTFLKPPELEPIINLSSEYAELLPGQKFIVIAKIRNPSKFYELTDIKAKLNAPHNNETIQSLDRLKPNESYPIISNTLIAPNAAELDGSNSINISLNIDYKSSGISKSLTKSLEIKITSLNETSSNATATKEIIQTAQETRTEEKAAEARNQTEQSPLITSPIEKIKSSLSIKEILLMGIVVFLVFVVASFVINRIRKRKKGRNELEEGILKDLKEDLPKE